MIGTTPVMATAPMPACTMKIFVGGTTNEVVAENVKIGDKLTLSIAIDYQGITESIKLIIALKITFWYSIISLYTFRCLWYESDKLLGSGWIKLGRTTSY